MNVELAGTPGMRPHPVKIQPPPQFRLLPAHPCAGCASTLTGVPARQYTSPSAQKNVSPDDPAMAEHFTLTIPGDGGKESVGLGKPGAVQPDGPLLQG